MERASKRDRLSGFTLIEILFALGVIAVLASILFLAGSAVLGGSQEKSTKVTLTALKGMLAEYDAKTRLAQSPKFWIWYDSSGLPIVRTATGNEDFWKVPMRDTASSAIPPTPFPLDAPGSVREGDYNAATPDQSSPDELTRNGSRQILNTQLAMGRLLQMDANRTALTRYKADDLFTPRFVGGNRLPGPGTDRVLYFGTDGTTNIIYPQGAKIKVVLPVDPPQTQNLICINQTPGYVTASTTPPTVGADWAVDNSPATPIILDAWRNPIIFVPGSGLRVRMLNGKDKLYDSGPDAEDQIMIVVSPEGKIEKVPNVRAKLIKEGRPFFASAGEDGDFAKGDDNLYSFDQ